MSRRELSQLSDQSLISELDRLVFAERARLVEILEHLIEVEDRKLHLELGFSSLFDYCVSRLKHSHSTAGRRIATARALRRFPEVGPMLASGELNLTTLAMTARLLTPANRNTLLERIRGKSQRAVECIVAEYRPESSTRDRVRVVSVREPMAPDPRAAITPGAGSAQSPPAVDPPAHRTTTPDPATIVPPPTRFIQKHELKFIASVQFIAKLEEVKTLLSHRLPGVTLEHLFDATMETFLDANCPARRDRRRNKRRQIKAQASRQDIAGIDEKQPIGDPKASTSLPAPGVDRARGKQSNVDDQQRMTRHIPAAIRDAVYTRDRGRCAWVGPGGTRCNARRHLELDHIEPFGRGGVHTSSNLRLLCRAHNVLAAEHAYGREKIAQFTRRQ